jgi:hypothetical protein
MARFMSLHRSPGLSKEDFAANGAEIVNGRYAQHVVTYINFFDGTIVNLFDADTEEMLVKEFERVGFPYEEIHEVHLTATTDDLRAMIAS